MALVIDDYKKNFNTTVVGTSVTVITQQVARTNYSQYYYPSSRVFEFNNRPMSLFLNNFHKKNNKLATITVVRPPARFGEVNINYKKNLVTN